MDLNKVKFSVEKFEKMINEKSLLFFDSFEFEDIITYYLENGKIDYARKAVNLSLKQHPFSTNLILLKAELYINENRLYEAEELLESILSDDNINLEIHILKANISSKMKLHSQAIDHLNKALLVTENKNEIYYLIGIEFLFLKNYNEAKLNFINSLNYNSSDHASLYNIIYCFDELNKKYDLIYFLNSYLEKNPYCEISWYNLGKQYYSLKKIKKALKSYDYAILVDENFTSPYIEKGKIQEKLGRYQDAINTYKILLSINKTSAHALLKIGYCYEKNGNKNKALAFYYKAVHYDPSFDKGWYRLAKYFSKNKEYKKAIYYIEKAIKINQEKSKYWKLYLKYSSLISGKN